MLAFSFLNKLYLKPSITLSKKGLLEYCFLQMHLKSHIKKHIKKENWYHFVFVFKTEENNYSYSVAQCNASFLIFHCFFSDITQQNILDFFSSLCLIVS